jgi:hypothetical protein
LYKKSARPRNAAGGCGTKISSVYAQAAAFALAESARTGSNAAATGVELDKHARDWDWLVGNWDVWHRRLKDRLAGSNDWEEFTGKSALWLTLGGLGTLDDNIMDLPGGRYYGVTIRAFDPSKRQWSLWWLDGRDPSALGNPVIGSFEGDTGTFIGKDTFKGRPITVRFRWLDIHGSRPWWEQAFSTDDGVTWEVNWRNYFTRTSATAELLPVPQGAGLDEQRHAWDFLVGSWKVHNRRFRRIDGRMQWEEFSSTLVNRRVLGGLGNVGDNEFDAPNGRYRGVSVRAFDAKTQQWLTWWLDGRFPATFNPPVRGSFTNGALSSVGDDVVDGRPIKVRTQWSQITHESCHWEQALSYDGGANWETNWISEFARSA